MGCILDIASLIRIASAVDRTAGMKRITDREVSPA